MRNKAPYIFLFLFCLFVGVGAWADTIVVSHGNSFEKLILGNKKSPKLLMDSLYKVVPCDTATLPSQAFEAGFKNKYAGDKEFDYNRDKAHDNFLARWIKKIKEWIAWLSGYSSEKQMPKITTIVFQIIAGLVVLLALYFLIRFMMAHSGNWFFKKKNNELELDIHDAEQLIRSADFDTLIRQTERTGDTRQAIRLFYLWLLKDMKDNQLIDWHPEKTNADYMYELRDEKLRAQFSYLSYLFNHIWYGRFSINDSDYLSARKAFTAYLKKEAADE